MSRAMSDRLRVCDEMKIKHTSRQQSLNESQNTKTREIEESKVKRG